MGVKRTGDIYQTRHTSSNGFAQSITIHGNQWSDIGAWGQHSGFDRSVFRHSYSDDKEDQMKRWDGNDYK